MIQDLLSPAVLAGIVYSGIRLATPYLYAALGETIGQLSGVLNLGVEGMMLMGAYAGFYLTYRTGDPWLGLLAAILMGAILGLANALITVTFRAEQGISGIGVFLFGLGMSELLFQKTLGSVATVSGFPPIRLPFLGDLPVVGDLLFNHNLMVYAAYLLVPLVWLVLNRTTWGLKIKSAGQNPAAADALGVSITRVRYATVTVGGILASVAGASLSIALLNVFQQNLTSGMGFIAVALVYFGGWSPLGALAGSLLFSTVNALQNWIQVLGIPIAPDFALMLPYVLTILMLVVPFRKARQPAALTKPFERGEG
ncbi:MAG TPA: ABC transporter permease [Anaerolineales bacterium]|nr:ABC transporter permease [Anaerolineales bacterium]